MKSYECVLWFKFKIHSLTHIGNQENTEDGNINKTQTWWQYQSYHGQANQ